MKHDTVVIRHTMDAETFVWCEKAARASGKKTVAEWIAFILSEKVGHTQFCPKR